MPHQEQPHIKATFSSTSNESITQLQAQSARENAITYLIATWADGGFDLKTLQSYLTPIDTYLKQEKIESPLHDILETLGKITDARDFEKQVFLHGIDRVMDKDIGQILENLREPLGASETSTTQNLYAEHQDRYREQQLRKYSF
jgi:hypothetical protein